ncbi:hypothetical protein CC79DRAFT_1360335 [Sarocladium strictum]
MHVSIAYFHDTSPQGRTASNEPGVTRLWRDTGDGVSWGSTGDTEKHFKVEERMSDLSVPGSQQDRQLLHYFCVEGSTHISGFIKHEFWSRTVLLASQDDHIVRQSLVALSALHADLSHGGSSSAAREETLLRYGKALRALQRRLGAKDGSRWYHSTGVSKTTLICCVLFHCFELSLGNGPAAMSHLQNGLQLLGQGHDRTAQEDDVFRSLKDTLSRLDLQATLFDDGRMPSLHLMPPADTAAPNRFRLKASHHWNMRKEAWSNCRIGNSDSCWPIQCTTTETRTACLQKCWKRSDSCSNTVKIGDGVLMNKKRPWWSRLTWTWTRRTRSTGIPPFGLFACSMRLRSCL